MAVTSFTFASPTGMQGLEDSFPDELKGPILELIRRYQQNNEALINSIRSQCVVDSSIVPSQTSGASDPVELSVSTGQDAETSEMISILWEL